MQMCWLQALLKICVNLVRKYIFYRILLTPFMIFQCLFYFCTEFLLESFKNIEVCVLLAYASYVLYY